MQQTLGAHKVLGFEQIASPAVSTALTVPGGARIALFSAEVQNIRFRSDGTAPTAAIGARIVKDLNPFMYVGDLKAIRVIQETAGGILNVEYLG